MDDLEQCLIVLPKVYAFRVPPAASVGGYKAKEWDKQHIWVGRLRVTSKGNKGMILLEHQDQDGYFAECPIMEGKTVEPVSDSSRYFVLKIHDTKTGRHAFLGIGFDERAHAFDFKVAVQDCENKTVHGDERAEEFMSRIPDQDFSIPQGGKIRVSLPGAKSKKKKEDSDEDDEEEEEVAAKPKKKAEKEEKKKKKKKEKEAPAAGGGGGDDFGFGGLDLSGGQKKGAMAGWVAF